MAVYTPPISHMNSWRQKQALRETYDAHGFLEPVDPHDEHAGQGAFERDYTRYELDNGREAPNFHEMFAEPHFHISQWSGRKKAAVAAGVVLALGAVAGYVVPSALRGKWNPFQSSWWNFGGSANKTAGRRRLQGQQQLLRDGSF